MYQAKRGTAITSNYSSRNATQTDIAKGIAAGLSNKVPSNAGDNQRSNDNFLRLKRVTNMINNNQGSGGKDSTGKPQK